MGGEEIASAAARIFRAQSVESSDLPGVLADVANKSVEVGAQVADTTFQMWCAEGSTKDFKSINAVSMSGFGDVKEIAEGDDFEESKFSDKKESAYLKTFGRMTTISRKAQINDDMSAFTEIPRLMAIAHLQKINRTVYDSLVSSSLAGPTMSEDGNHLFDTTNHVNVYGAGSTPSLTSLATARQMFRAIKNLKAQNDDTAVPGGRTPRYIISGPINETAIENVVSNLPQILLSNTTVVNPYTALGRTPLVPVIDAYLGDLAATAGKSYLWYLASNQLQLPTYKVYYLNGNKTPTFRAENSVVGKALGISLDSFFDWTLLVQDWRGLLLVEGDGA
jgi:hypothetical protein